MEDLDAVPFVLLNDTLDAIATAWGHHDQDEAAEESARAVLLAFARVVQRDTLAAVLSGGVAQGFSGRVGATVTQPTREEPPAPEGDGGPFQVTPEGVKFNPPA